MSERVVLYRVRRPDGTVIEAPPGHDRNSAIRNVISNKADVGLLASYRAGCLAKALEGYTIEPVEFAEMPSEETRATVLRWLQAGVTSPDRNFEPVAELSALSELERIWGK